GNGIADNLRPFANEPRRVVGSFIDTQCCKVRSRTQDDLHIQLNLGSTCTDSLANATFHQYTADGNRGTAIARSISRNIARYIVIEFEQRDRLAFAVKTCIIQTIEIVATGNLTGRIVVMRHTRRSETLRPLLMCLQTQMLGCNYWWMAVVRCCI